MMFYILAFAAGAFFGMIVMSIMICAGNASRREEKEEKQNME